MMIAVAVSGGMDSLLSLALLQEKGMELIAVHGFFLPRKNRRTAEKIAEQCHTLGIEFHALDLREQFQACVADGFVQDYAAGRTPNPCARCNPAMKFGVLFDEAATLGATHIATGHYVRLLDEPDMGRLLIRGADPRKDQSYFLSLVPRDRMEKAVFPLGGIEKKDVPAMLDERGLSVPVPSESQEICFVPDDDYQAYLINNGKNLPGPGDITLADGTKVGKHAGLWRHTQGQRRGLGIAWTEPLYVIDKDVAANRLIVGPREQLLSSGCVAGEMNILVAPERWPEKVLAQTRYRQKATLATPRIKDNKLIVEFAEPQSRPAPGQIAALYTEHGAVLAGGIIEDILPVDGK